MPKNHLRSVKNTCVVTSFACICIVGGAAEAEPASLIQPVDALITPAFVEKVRDWASAPVVLMGLEGRRQAGTVDQTRIDALDAQWRSEIGTGDMPLVTSVLANPLSSYLTQIQAHSTGLFTEIFVMDHNGLNVGQSATTSDYWQGDEAKFQKTYGTGRSTVFIGEPEFHDATATWRVQLNMTVDGATGRPAGAITVEVNLTELERRTLADLQS